MEIGELIDGKYELVRMIGRGAMGTVYLAEHKILGKKVAIKILHEQFADNAVFVERFYREARSAASVGHKGIVEVHDVGQTPDGSLFLVMEYLDGKSLSAILKARKKLNIDESVEIAAQILEALAAVHEKEIVHRDLKPGNIFLCTERGAPPVVKLLDFGVSKMTKADLPDITSDSDVVGTLSYMSPEQARRSKDADHQSDLWAVGTIVYQMLVGRLPHKSGTIDQVLISLMTEDIVPPKQLRDDIPDDLDAAIMKALQRDVKKRYSDAQQFLAALGVRDGLPQPRRHAPSTEEEGPTGVYRTPTTATDGSGEVALPDDSHESSSSPGEPPSLDEDTEVSSPSQNAAALEGSHSGQPPVTADSYVSQDSSGGAISTPSHSTPLGGSEFQPPASEQTEPSLSGTLDTFASVITSVTDALPPRTLLWVALAASVMGIAVVIAAAVIVLSDDVDEGDTSNRDLGAPSHGSTRLGDHTVSTDDNVSHPSSVETNVLDEDDHSRVTSVGGEDDSGSHEDTIEEGTTESSAPTPLTTEEISIGLRKIRPMAQRCLGPHTSGPAKVYVTVHVDGTGATLFRGALPRPNATAVRCLRRTVEEMRFRSTGGATLEVRFPYSRPARSGPNGTGEQNEGASSPSSTGTESLKRSPFRR